MTAPEICRPDARLCRHAARAGRRGGPIRSIVGCLGVNARKIHRDTPHERSFIVRVGAATPGPHRRQERMSILLGVGHAQELAVREAHLARPLDLHDVQVDRTVDPGNCGCSR